MLSLFLQGFALQAGVILALGAQNIFVLNSGINKQNHFLVALVCSICDLLLIFLGVAGAASFFIKYPILKFIFGILGLGLLIFYAFLKLYEIKQTDKSLSPRHKSLSVRQSIFISLGFSLLNPHVYFDTIVLIGGYSAQYSRLAERIYFGSGAAFFSSLWFFGLVILASAGHRLLKSPKYMKIVNLVSAIILLALSVKLGLDIF